MWIAKPNLFTSVPLLYGKQLSGGNEVFAKEMLKALLTSLPKEQQIEKAYQTKDIKQLKAYAHKLHGGRSYRGAPLLKSAAAKLEAFLMTLNLSPLMQ